MFYYLPPSRPSMARRKMYKTVTNVHTEDIADSDWSSFMIYKKQDNSMTSAYIDRVKISWVLDQEDNPNSELQGFLFAASLDSALDSSTPSNNSGNIISATAGNGAGGVAYLDIKRRIISNESQHSTTESTAGWPVYLHVRSNEIGEATKLYVIVETWGRWFEATDL